MKTLSLLLTTLNLSGKQRRISKPEKRRGWYKVWKVHTSEWAEKFLNKLDQHIRIRIEERLKKLEDNPVPSDAKFIGRDEWGQKVFRYRMGDFRALYKIKESEDIVLITKIDKRPRVYERN